MRARTPHRFKPSAEPQRGAVAILGDEEVFAQQVVAFLCDQSRHQRLADEARTLASEWSDEARAERMAQAYTRLFGASHASENLRPSARHAQ